MRTRTTPSGYIIRLTEQQHKKLVVAFSPSSLQYHRCPLCIEAEVKWEQVRDKTKYPITIKCAVCPAFFPINAEYPGFVMCVDLVADILNVPKVSIECLSNMRQTHAGRNKEEKKWARTLWTWLKEMEYEEDEA